MRDHRGGFGSWSVDRDTVLGMRRERAGKALATGEAGLALAEAEELLDEHPDDVEALRIVSQAALSLGDPLMAGLASDGIVRRRPEDARAWVELALARLHQGELKDSLDAAERGLAVDDQQALGWHLVGLLRTRLGMPEGDQAHSRAAALEPDRFPAPRPTSPARWAQALEQAQRSLPPPLQRFYQGLPLRLDGHPEPAALRAYQPPLSPLVPALALGEAPTDDPWEQRPRTVLLFTANLGWPPCDGDELVARIQAALLDVAVDWLGEDPLATD